MAITKLVADSLGAGATPNQSAFKNIIINGDMSIAQRGTSETGITGSGYYTVDRWRIGADTGGTWTQSQSTDVPSGQGFAKSSKLDCTTANGSLSANSAFFLTQRVEGQNLQYLKKGTANAESLTASFWVKSNKTGTYILMLDDTDNNRSFSQSYTISSADTWEKKTITFAGDTSGAFNNDNARSFDLRFWLVAGTNYTSGTLNTSWNSNTNANLAVGQVNLADSTSNEWYITGVQLEAGTTASDFEFLPFDVNKQRCQRYFQRIEKYVAATGERWSTNLFWAGFKLDSAMRGKPTLTKSDGSTTDIGNFDNAGSRDGSVDLSSTYSDSDSENWKSGYVTVIMTTSFNPDINRAGTWAVDVILHFDAEL